MKRFRYVSGAIALFLLMAVAGGQTPEAIVLTLGSARVAESKGDVTLHSPKGELIEVKRGIVLEPETSIETGNGSLLLDLSDGSQVLVKSKTRVVLKSPETGPRYYLELLVGKVLTKIQKRLSNSPSFRMGTPTAVITVRGTRFEVEVNKDNRTFVEVYEGVVEVLGMRSGTAPVLIRPGFSTWIRRDQDPEQPRNWRDDSSRGDDDRGGFGRTPGQRDDRSDTPSSDSSRSESEGDREPHP
jgi:FecR-like protein